MYGFWAELEDLIEPYTSSVNIAKHKGDLCSDVKLSSIRKYKFDSPHRIDGCFTNPQSGTLLFFDSAKHLDHFSWNMQSYSETVGYLGEGFSWSIFCASPGVECKHSYKNTIACNSNSTKTKEFFDAEIFCLNPYGYIQLIANRNVHYNDKKYYKNSIFSLGLTNSRSNLIKPAIINIFRRQSRVFIPCLKNQLLQINTTNNAKINDNCISSFVLLKNSTFKNDSMSVQHKFYKCLSIKENDVIIVDPRYENSKTSTILSFKSYQGKKLLSGEIITSFVDDNVPLYIFTANLGYFWFGFRNRNISNYSINFNNKIIDAGFYKNQMFVTLKEKSKWIKLNFKGNVIEITPLSSQA